jgi:hypothetical protein
MLYLNNKLNNFHFLFSIAGLFLNLRKDLDLRKVESKIYVLALLLEENHIIQKDCILSVRFGLTEDLMDFCML